MNEYHIKAKWSELQEHIHALGTVTAYWKDIESTFNFRCYDSECTDELICFAEQHGIEIELV